MHVLARLHNTGLVGVLPRGPLSWFDDDPLFWRADFDGEAGIRGPEPIGRIGAGPRASASSPEPAPPRGIFELRAEGAYPRAKSRLTEIVSGQDHAPQSPSYTEPHKLPPPGHTQLGINESGSSQKDNTAGADYRTSSGPVGPLRVRETPSSCEAIFLTLAAEHRHKPTTTAVCLGTARTAGG